jgi:para-nitrobenzyl esterase
LVEANSGSWQFYPAIDGRIIPEHPFQLMKRGLHADVPLIAGFNRNEGGVFPPLGGGSPKEFEAALDDVYGDQAGAARQLFPVADAEQAAVAGRAVFADVVFNWNSAALASAQARFGTAAAYLYHFAYAHSLPADSVFEEGRGSTLGACHGAEISYALKNLDTRPWPVSDAQRRLMRTISSYWINFVKFGDPNSPGLAPWPPYAPGNRSVLLMDPAAFVAVDLPFRDRLELLGVAMGNDVLRQRTHQS